MTVHYNPADPSLSCLEPGVNLGVAFLIGIGCIGMGLLIILSGIISLIRGRM